MKRYDLCDSTCTTDCGHCKGAGIDPNPIYDRAAWDNGFAPIPQHAAPFPRCTNVGASGLLCDPCAGEIATRLRDPDDELVSVYHSGHGFQHGLYRPDVTR